MNCEKNAIISLTHDDGRGNPSAVAEGDNSFPESTLILEYFVPGARWTPTYVCCLDSQKNTASLALRAFICQQTGEDWKGVKIELSTANPQSWCELPELASIKLGRAQRAKLPRGWRKPPIGMETLFADYDRYRASISVTQIKIKEEQQFWPLDGKLSVPKKSSHYRLCKFLIWVMIWRILVR